MSWFGSRVKAMKSAAPQSPAMNGTSRVIVIALALTLGLASCARAVPCVATESCNYLDDNCDGRADETFINAAGLYFTAQNCGACDVRCAAVYPTAATTECHRRILGLLSLGAVVENMVLRAGEFGMATQTTWSFVNGDGRIAKLAFQTAAPVVGGLATAITTRHTNRRMYRGPAMTDGELSDLTGEVGASQGVRLIWLQGAARRRAQGLIWRAESERFLRRRLHDEIFSSIRFDLSWRETAQWALPPGALEIEVPMRPMFKALRHWALMRPLSWIGVHHLVGMRAGWLPCWQAPALGVLVTPLPVEVGAVAVGAALERLWLRATLLDLALQPLAASAVLPLQSSADCGASDELRSALTAGWQTIAPGATPLMVFRIGRATPPGVRTSRKPVEEYAYSGQTA